MITVVHVDKIEDLTPLMAQQEYNDSIDRYRSMYLYRGMSNSDFSLVTSLQRNCKDKKAELEPRILRSFTKYAVIEDPELPNSVWRQMVRGQHHGLPTRLLDWSQSPLVSLHFAVSEPNLDNLGDHDCVIWRLDARELDSFLPEKYADHLRRHQTPIFSLQGLSNITNSIEEYDRDMDGKAMVIVEPPSLDFRIVNQFSYFLVVPIDVDDVEEFLDKNTQNTIKYIINKDLRWRIRDMLDQLNVSERTMYPGFDGLSKWLGRYYFVK